MARIESASGSCRMRPIAIGERVRDGFGSSLPTTGRRSAASPPTWACAPSSATSAPRSRPSCASRSTSRGPGAPTPASTRGARWCPATCRPTPTSATSSGGSTSCARRRSPSATPSGPPTTSTPGSRPAGASTATTCGTPRRPTRCWRVGRGSSPQPLSLWAMQAACDPLLGEHDFTSFCRRPKVDDGEPEPSLVRRVSAARWSEVDGWDGAPPALRDPGQRVLPPDGALDRRHARRRRVGQGHAR